MFQTELVIAGRRIAADEPPYIICELSANHNGSLDRLMKLMEVAATTGCDAIKIQSYTPDTMTIDHDSSEFKVKGGLWDGYSLYELYAEAHTPFEWHEAIFAKAKDLGVTIFSSAFDETAVDLLESINAPAYKVASFEVVDLPLIERVAKTGKPIIISTGLANLAEIETAVKTARQAGCEQLAVLHCISSYPAPCIDSNLRTMPHLGAAFNAIPGLSDHTHGSAVSIAAIALGACIIEKHFTIDRSEGGPDSAFSLEPDEFRQLTASCKDAWQALGRISYNLKGSEQGNAVFRRSLYVVKNIQKGEALTPENVRSIRPGYGLPPKYYQQIMRCKAKEDIPFGTALCWSLVVQ